MTRLEKTRVINRLIRKCGKVNEAFEEAKELGLDLKFYPRSDGHILFAINEECPHHEVSSDADPS
jgi:hypothetical protein